MAENGSCQWSNLPSDLIHLISTKLPDLSDRVRLRAVCKMWQSSASILDPSPRLPWLMSSDNIDGNEEILYYSLSSQKTYKIHCPQSKHTFFPGTFGGFILCYRHSQSVSLFNPLTRLEISLPFPKYFGVFGVVSNPLREDFAVVLASTQQNTSEIFVGYLMPDDGAWVIHASGTVDSCVCVYYEGMYYVNKYGVYTQIMDATTGEVVSTIPSPETSFDQLPYHQYMLETCGEILIIYRHDKTTCKMKEIDFDIYRLDEVRGNYQWVKLRGIGDRMLFLNYVGGFCLSASEFPGFKGNCIYFQYAEPSRASILLCRHDIENGNTEVLPNFWGKWGTWIIPSLAK